MIIKAQSGEFVEIHDIMLKGCELLYPNPENKEENKTIGVYGSRERATEVYAEIVCSSWNKSKLYEMPEK